MAEPSNFSRESPSQSTPVRPVSSISVLAEQLKSSSIREKSNSPNPTQLISVDRASLYLRRLSTRGAPPLDSADSKPSPNVEAEINADPSLAKKSFGRAATYTEGTGTSHLSPSTGLTDELDFHPLSAPNFCMSTCASLPAFIFTASSSHVNPNTADISSWGKTSVLTAGEKQQNCFCKTSCNCVVRMDHLIPCKRVCRSFSERSAMHHVSRYSSQHTLQDLAAFELYRNTLPRPVAVRLRQTQKPKSLSSSASFRESREVNTPRGTLTTPRIGNLPGSFSRSAEFTPSECTLQVPVLRKSRVGDKQAQQSAGLRSSSDSGNSPSSGLDLTHRGPSAFTPTRMRSESAQGESGNFLDYSFSPATDSSTGPFPALTPSSGFHDTQFSFPESSSLPDHIRPGENFRDPQTNEGQCLTKECVSEAVTTCCSHTTGLKRRRGPSGEEQLPTGQTVLLDANQFLVHSQFTEESERDTSSPKILFHRQETIVATTTASILNDCAADTKPYLFSSGNYDCSGKASPEIIVRPATGPSPSQLTAVRLASCKSKSPGSNGSTSPFHCSHYEVHIPTSPSQLQSQNRYCQARKALSGFGQSLEETEEESLGTESELFESLSPAHLKRTSVCSSIILPSIFEVTFEPIRDPMEEQPSVLSPTPRTSAIGSVPPSETKTIRISRGKPACDIIICLASSDSDDNSDDEQIISPQLINRQRYFDGCVRQVPSESSSAQNTEIDLSLIENN